MTAYRKVVPGFSLLAVVAVAGLGTVLTWLVLGPEATLRRGFETALAQQAPAGDVALAESSLDRQHLWLSRSDDQPLGSAGPVEVGARITISDRNGRARTLEVVDVRRIDIGGMPGGETPAGLLMVSCRETGSGKSVIRFLMEADPLDAVTHRVHAQRAL